MTDPPDARSGLIDSHCHLNDPRFEADLPSVIDRAASAGITTLVVVGYDLPTSEFAVRLALEHEPIYAAVGVHPHDSQTYDDRTHNRFVELAAEQKVVAIGEVGLDYHYDFSPRGEQFRAFRDQLTVARETELPVIVHCREAYADTIDVLDDAGIAQIGGVMHCWGGDEAAAARVLGQGMYLGFAGTVTFKNADEIRAVARAIPLERLLVETDAPYLAPVPYRGKRNEPAYVRAVADRLAAVRGIPASELADATSRNVRALFTRIR